MTKEKRAALQSVRAKARKGLAVQNADLPKTVAGHLNAVIAFVDKAIAPKKAAETETAETADTSPELEEQAQAA